MENQSPPATTPQPPTTQNLPPSRSVAQTSPAQEQAAATFANSTSNSKPKLTQTAASIAKSSKTILEISLLFTLAIFVLNLAIIFIIQARVNQIQTNRQQALTIQRNSTELQAASQFLSTQTNQLQTIKDALPNERTLVDFVTTTEALMAGSSTNGRLEFSALAPQGKPNPFIPFIITMSTDKQNFLNFLSQVEKLPFLVQVNQIEANNLNQSNPWDFTLSAQIYVQDPFNAP